MTLNVSLNQLRTVDEVPYPAAIKAGVKLIMVSWAVYPALDPNHPAGLSSAVVQGELRGHIGWQGVTITDALEAGALSAYGNAGQRAVDAAEAGMDLLLCSCARLTQGEPATARWPPRKQRGAGPGGLRGGGEPGDRAAGRVCSERRPDSGEEPRQTAPQRHRHEPARHHHG